METCSGRKRWVIKWTKPVDRDALMAVAAEMEKATCDNLGELSFSLGDVWGWAGRIKEACRVIDHA